MDINTLRDAMHAAPFKPFHVGLADGRSFFVPHPDFIAASPRRVVFINPTDESIAHIEPLLIVSLDFPHQGSTPATAGGTANGPSGQGSGGPA